MGTSALQITPMPRGPLIPGSPFLGRHALHRRHRPGEHRHSLGSADGTPATATQWGSPMAEGGLMAMADATVRLFPYSLPLTNFLLPNDGNAVTLPN